MSKIGIQSQNGTINDFDRVAAKLPIAWMLLGNALGLKLARDIRARSKNTFLVLRTGGDWDYKSQAFIQGYLDDALRIAEPFQRAGLCDMLCPPNEPVVRNDVEAQQLNDQQVWYAGQLKAHGYRTGAYNFSVGNPDYPLWPWLQDGIRACDNWLLVHQYDVGAAHPEIFADTSLRHEKFIPLLAADVQANLKIGITECLDDLNTDGSIYGHGGGYRKLPDNGRLIQDYVEHLQWWEGEIAKEPRIKFATVFGYSMLEPWVGLGFDVANIDGDRQAFIDWLSPGVVDLSPTPPPNPEPEPDMTIEQERVKHAWESVGRGMDATGIPYDPTFAFPQAAIKYRLGAPLGKEYRYADQNGVPQAAQAFALGIVQCRENDFGNVLAYSLNDGKPLSATPTPEPPQPPVNKRLTTADVSQYGFRVEPYMPAPGEEFYGLVAIGNIQSGPQVSTTSTMFAVNAVGGAVIGEKLVHAYDSANHKFEKHDSPSVGIVLGPGSYIGPAGPQDRFYVALNDGQPGVWPTPKGDVLVAGMPNGQHWQATYTWQLMRG